MKLKKAKFNKKREDPKSFLVEISAKELGIIYRYAGSIAPIDITNTAGLRWSDANNELATSAGDIIARFWDNGVDDIVPGSFSLEAIINARRERLG